MKRYQGLERRRPGPLVTTIVVVYPMHWIDPLISFFRLSVCLLTNRLSNDYVHNSLPIFTKFCMRLRNVVASTPVVCETNRK